MANRFQVTFDANDVPGLVAFWATALGYIEQPSPAGFDSWQQWAAAEGIPREEWDSRGALIDPEGVGPRIFFQRVPEGKAGKNRVHLDVNAGGGQDADQEQRRDAVDAHVERLLAMGGALVQEFNEDEERWIVMQDPEGNEFCVQ